MPNPAATGTVTRPAGPAPNAGRTAWIPLATLVVVLVAILVFILQNGRKVEVRFLMLDGQLPLGVALLFAVLLGGSLIVAAGATRAIRSRLSRH